MQDKEKVNKVRELCYEIIGRNIAFVEGNFGTYYDYDKVMGMLDQVVEELDQARTPRPVNLPDDIPWSEALWNGEEEANPFVFDGSMSVVDFKKFQDKYFSQEPGDKEVSEQRDNNSEFYHVLASHHSALTLHIKIDEIHQEYKGLGYNIIDKKFIDFTYQLEDGTQVSVAWDPHKEVIYEDVVRFPVNYKHDVQ